MSGRHKYLQRRAELGALRDAIARNRQCVECGAPSSKAKISPDDSICSRCRPRLGEIREERKEIEDRQSERALSLKSNEGSW